MSIYVNVKLLRIEYIYFSRKHVFSIEFNTEDGDVENNL